MSCSWILRSVAIVLGGGALAPELPAQLAPAPTGWTRQVVDGEAVYRPVVEPEFAVHVGRPQRVESRKVRSWFKRLVAASEGRRPELLKAGRATELRLGKAKDPSGGYLAVSRYRTGAGETRFTQHFGLPVREDAAVYVHCEFSTLAAFLRHQEEVRSLFPKQFLAWHAAKQAAAKRAKTERQRQQRRERRLAKARWAKPGQGLRPAEVETLLYSMESKMDGYGNLQPKPVLHLLLTDGTVYSDSRVPPGHFAAAVSKRHEPERWSKWRRIADSAPARYERQVPGTETWAVIPGRPVRALGGAPDTKLELTHLRAWGNAFLGGGHSRSKLVLHPDGRFESSRFGLALSGDGMADAGMGRVTSSKRSDPDGESSTSTATADGTFVGGSRRKSGGADHTGRFAVNGLCVTFHHDSGRVSRSLVFWPGDDNKWLVIDGRAYKNAAFESPADSSRRPPSRRRKQ